MKPLSKAVGGRGDRDPWVLHLCGVVVFDRRRCWKPTRRLVPRRRSLLEPHRARDEGDFRGCGLGPQSIVGFLRFDGHVRGVQVFGCCRACGRTRMHLTQHRPKKSHQCRMRIWRRPSALHPSLPGFKTRGRWGRHTSQAKVAEFTAKAREGAVVELASPT